MNVAAKCKSVELLHLHLHVELTETFMLYLDHLESFRYVAREGRRGKINRRRRRRSNKRGRRRRTVLKMRKKYKC